MLLYDTLKFILFALLIAGAVGPAAAQSDRPLVPREDVEYRFWSDEHRPVSGQLVVGIQAANREPLDDGTVIAVFGTDDADGVLCIEFEGLSGLYGAQAIVRSIPMSAEVAIDVPLNRVIVERKDLAHEIAMKAWFSKNSSICIVGEGDVIDYVIPSFGQSSPSALIFYLNTPVGSVARVSIRGKAESTPCEYIHASSYGYSSRNIQAFNRRCALSLPTSCESRTPFEVIVDVGTRRHGEDGILRRVCPGAS